MTPSPTVVVNDAPEASRTANPQVLREGESVVADAKVSPIHIANAIFQVRGIIVAVLVSEGQVVRQGDPLVELDKRSFELAIQQAQAELTRAKASYEQLLIGVSPPEVLQAQARLDRARSMLQVAIGSVADKDIAAAKAQVDSAKAKIDLLLSSPSADSLRLAELAVDEARATLETVRSERSAAKTLAESALTQAALQLQDRQQQYSVLIEEHQKLEELSPSQVYEEDAARRAIKQAKERLDQAQVTYDAAREQEANSVSAAETRLTTAQTRLTSLQKGTSEADIASARADLAEVEARLARLTGTDQENSIAAAKADVALAEAVLEGLTTGPSKPVLMSAAASVLEAEATVKLAEMALENATLRAPIAGTVARVDVQIGDRMTDVAMPSVVIADLSSWLIEVSDLSELSIARIRKGDQATISFYAIPELQISGTVDYIHAIGSSQGRETSYNVTIMPEEWDDRLRWNMSASVKITPAQK